ncbi:unnamed protein product [Chondrus crispus]|uniref:Uncharacterized protein n=1 Tax=Chondrus crispus TaxID=2769 RepID=R7QT68_CHOCR|nr:unnamed protein product [Chondrus crispus]CDF40706.1 unnamed protein product [Chondrus crispus]|eukprot:XP_005711000.1 unnamed protein product [Chondrus crispus]
MQQNGQQPPSGIVRLPAFRPASPSESPVTPCQLRQERYDAPPANANTHICVAYSLSASRVCMEHRLA